MGYVLERLLQLSSLNLCSRVCLLAQAAGHLTSKRSKHLWAVISSLRLTADCQQRLNMEEICGTCRQPRAAAGSMQEGCMHDVVMYADFRSGPKRWPGPSDTPMVTPVHAGIWPPASRIACRGVRAHFGASRAFRDTLSGL